MNILADESVEYPVIQRLRSDGHTVMSIAEQSPGLPDRDVLATSVQGHLLLLTADRDFGDIVMRDLTQAPQEGVVLYRLRHILVSEKAEIVARAFAQHSARLAHAFSVVERTRIRHRPLPEASPDAIATSGVWAGEGLSARGQGTLVGGRVVCRRIRPARKRCRETVTLQRP